MTNPTRQEIIDAYTAATTLARLAEEFTPVRVEEHKEINDLHLAVRAALPPIPRPTMAEVKWDEEKHYLAEAEHIQFGKVIMLYKNPAADSIEVIYKNQDGITPSITCPGALTPTGRRYTPTEVQE